MSASLATLDNDYERRKRTGLRRDTMNFAASMKSLLLLALAATLTACGGGGGSDGGATTPPQGSLVASTTNIAINTRSATTLTVRVNQANGAAANDGVTVTAVVNGAGLGNLSRIGSGANGLTAQGATVGGVVNFLFQSGGAPATGSITLSAQDPVTPGRNMSQTVQVTISNGPSSDPRISFQPEKTRIPVNQQGVGFFLGSPYISEVLVNIRSASGQAINATRDSEQAVQYSVDPIEISAVSILDDPETDDVNELTTPWAAIFAGVESGTSRAYVWSENQPGTVNLRATFTDPDTGQRVEGVQSFTLVSDIPPLPASVIILPPNRPIYTRTSGGTPTGQLAVVVQDGNNAPVPNPVSGNNAFNNVRLEILAPASEMDATLSATNAAGVLQDGRSIVARTTDGSTNVLVRSGVLTGTFTVRATADRADNNVDNGITDPIIGDRAVVISDGRLFSIEITQPVEGIRENMSVDPTVTVTDPDGSLPLSDDGSYSMTVAVVATDRLGNPVIPGTTIQFGLIDEPQDTGFGDFDISGLDGNPQESGTTFTAPTGLFTTAGGGAGPGDALVLFGKDVVGNRDHESARVVTRVNTATNLTVARRFNANDDTGVSVNSGNVLPYIIGRATAGNIVAQATTNDLGVARTTMTYPVSHLGKSVIVWGQGEGDIIGGQAETVADVDPLVFAGLAPLELTASPSSIPANTTSLVTLCAIDAADSPLGGVVISYSFDDLEGTGSVDGNGPTGVLDTVTGANGCTTASVTTSGVLEEGTVVFAAGGDTAEVDIFTGTLVLQANPTALGGSGDVTLTLLNAQGVPQPGFLIIGSCTGSDGAIITLVSGPGVTNAQGQTVASISATNLDGIGEAGSGECIFSTADESVEVTVTLQGVDLCTIPISPQPPGCAAAVTFTVTLILNDAAGGDTTTGFQVSDSLGTLNCAAPEGGTQTCSAPVQQGQTINFQATSGGGGEEVNWSGNCAPFGGNPSTSATATVNAAITCTATDVTDTP
jgi:hypothetical protein